MGMKIVIDNRDSKTALIVCEDCGSEYTHHISVGAFARDADDANTGIGAVVTRGGKLSAETSMVDNPSRRRDGVSIDITCEQCESRGRLTIVQHKGQTVLTCE